MGSEMCIRDRNRGAVVGFADGNMFVDDRHVYSADGLRVGLFKDTSEF